MVAIKVYCEHSALTKAVRNLQKQGLITLLHFPYDPDSRSRTLSTLAIPSEAQVRDLNLSYSELPGSFDDYSGSEHYRAILTVVGPANRRDALHVDSAFKSGCSLFLTRDSDILRCREELTALLGILFLHPDHDQERLLAIVSATSPVRVPRTRDDSGDLT